MSRVTKWCKENSVVILIAVLCGVGLWWQYPKKHQREPVQIVRFWVNERLLQVPLSTMKDLDSRNPWDSIQVVGEDGNVYFNGVMGEFTFAIQDTIVK